MANRTEREFMIALTHLLDRVRVLNSWSVDSFRKAATHVANLKQSEASRFQKALLDMNYLTPGSDKRTLKTNFDPIYYKNTDACLSFIKEILEVNPDIIQQCGPKKGSKRVPVEPVIPEVVEEVIEEVYEPTLDEFSTKELIDELISRNIADNPKHIIDHLRSNGWVITCARETVVIETI